MSLFKSKKQKNESAKRHSHWAKWMLGFSIGIACVLAFSLYNSGFWYDAAQIWSARDARYKLMEDIKQRKAKPTRDLYREDGKFKTYYSDYIISRDTAVRIYWMDDTHVLFSGWASEGNVKLPADITIWEVGKNFTTYKSKAYLRCYSDNAIIYYDAEQQKYFAGEMGKEKPIDRPVYIDEMNCVPMDHDARFVEGHHRALLRKEHGYLDFGTYPPGNSQDITPVVFHKANGESVRLPLTEREAKTIISITYYPHLGAYMLMGAHPDNAGNWPEDEPHPLWRLYPNGKFETEMVAPPWSYGAKFAITKQGLIYGKYDMRKQIKQRDFGVFLIGPSFVEPLLKPNSYAPHMVVSPSGCRVAMGGNDMEQFDNPQGGRAYVVDLCSEQMGERK